MKVINSLAHLNKISSDIELVGRVEETIKDKYEILYYFLFFNRVSKNTYENLKLVCFYKYKGEKREIPLYGLLDEDEVKTFCKKFNAPRAPFWKELSKNEFFNYYKFMNDRKMSEAHLNSLIQHQIDNNINK